MTNPATVTKSIGLSADALLSWFLQRHLDSLIVTGQILPIYRDFAKTHANPDPSLRSGQAPMATPHTTGPLWAIALIT